MGDTEEDLEDYPDVRTKDLLVVHIPELKVSAEIFTYSLNHT